MEGLCRKNDFLVLIIMVIIFMDSANSSDHQLNNQITTLNSALENAITEHSITASHGAPANGETAGDKMAAPRQPSSGIMRGKEDCDSKGKSADGNQRNEANPRRKHGKSTKNHQFATRIKRSKEAIEADPELRRSADSGVNFPGGFGQYAGFGLRGMKGGGIIDGRWKGASGDEFPADEYNDFPQGGELQSLPEIEGHDQDGVQSYVQLKRNRIAEGFLGMRGKKAQDRKLLDGFLGMRGKKADDRKLLDGFLGMRGKKETEVKRKPVPDAFYGMRGKKEDTKRVPADAFYGMRGRKWSPEQNGDEKWSPEQNGGGGSDTNGATFNGGMLKRIPEGFLGMRGKKGSPDADGKTYSKRMATGSGYPVGRMRDFSATYPNFIRGLLEHSRANGNDRKRQIGSIFIGMRG